MTAREVLDLQLARWRSPGPWAILAGWTVLGAVPPVLQAHLPFTPLAWAAWLGAQLLTYGSFAWIGPLPWLWSGHLGGRPRTLPGAVLALGMGLLCLLLVAVPETLRHVAFQGRPFRLQIQAELAENAVPYLSTFLLVGLGLAALERQLRARTEAERREREAREVILRGQLSPHVLYNGMNNLARLVKKDPDRAEQAAEDLAELFRRLMDHAHRHLSPLGEERELVERYLALEALRLGDRLRVTWRWEAALDALEAPPFLLQPLVENALKHGLAPCPEGGALELVGRIDGDRVHLEVANTGQPFTVRATGGLGLRNLEGRLDLAFDRAWTFTLGPEGGRTVARLTFPRLQELS